MSIPPNSFPQGPRAPENSPSGPTEKRGMKEFRLPHDSKGRQDPKKTPEEDQHPKNTQKNTQKKNEKIPISNNNSTQKKDEKIPNENKNSLQKKREGEAVSQEAKQGGLGDALSALQLANSVTSASGVEATAKTDLSQVTELIKKLVNQMYVGGTDKMQMTRLELKASSDLPEAFTGAALTVTKSENGGVNINFSQFLSPAHETAALALVQQNEKQLHELVSLLQARGIEISNLQIGAHNVTLPQPSQKSELNNASASEQTRDQRDQGEREGGGGQNREREQQQDEESP